MSFMLGLLKRGLRLPAGLLHFSFSFGASQDKVLRQPIPLCVCNAMRHSCNLKWRLQPRSDFSVLYH